MILYNITINIEKESESDWLKWMKEVHIPAIMDSNLIQENKILKLLTEVHESVGVTYSFQFFFADQKSLEKFQEEHEPSLDHALYKKYQGKFVEFRTVLAVL